MVPTRKKKEVETEVFLAPYTFPRLDALLGYASGMAGPQFYQYVWEARGQKDPFGIAAEKVLVEATRLARVDGEIVGTADAIAAAAFSRSLAMFRGRPYVGRMEVLEAAQTCLIKGDAGLVGARLLRAFFEVMRGRRVGKLGASAGQSALVLDFHARCKEFHLPIEHGRPTPKELDIFKSPLNRRCSRFLHQCLYLEVGFGSRNRGPDLVTGQDLDLVMEHWDVQYTPELETRLVELSALGSTVEDVAAALLVKAFLENEGKSGPLATHLTRGLVMGLHKVIGRLVPKLAAAVFTDDDVLSLLGAGRQLRTVLRGRELLEASQVKDLASLAQQCFLQATLRLERLAGIAPDAVDSALELVSELLDVSLTDPSLAPSRDMILRHATAARELARGKAPAVLGALDGFLFQLGYCDSNSLASAMRALSRGKTRNDGPGAYLEGVLAVSRRALLGEDTLFGALIEHVRDSEWNDFVASLPALRRAFTRLTPRETETLADRAADVLGIPRGDAVTLFSAPPEVVAKLGEWEREAVASEQTWAGTPVAANATNTTVRS